MILVSDGTTTFTGFIYGDVSWSSAVQREIASAWQCDSSSGLYTHPASLSTSLLDEIVSSSNTSKNKF